MTTLRVLPADLYDTLELAATAFHGVGAAIDFQMVYGNTDKNCPVCIYGLARFADPLLHGRLLGHLYNIGISREVNDWTVRKINMRKGRENPYARVTFKQWCKELNVVRGEQSL